MGHIYVDVTMKNAIDVGNYNNGLISEAEIRQVTVEAMVDTGATYTIMGEDIFNKLGLKSMGQRNATLANDIKATCKRTEPVEIHWKDRTSVMSALVMEGTTKVILGVFPLEDMDLMIDPIGQTLVGVHGDEPLAFAVGVR